MEILSKDILTLLRDADFRATVEQVVDDADAEPRTITVNLQKDEPDSATRNGHEARIVTIRRLAS